MSRLVFTAVVAIMTMTGGTGECAEVHHTLQVSRVHAGWGKIGAAPADDY